MINTNNQRNRKIVKGIKIILALIIAVVLIGSSFENPSETEVSRPKNQISLLIK